MTAVAAGAPWRAPVGGGPEPRLWGRLLVGVTLVAWSIALVVGFKPALTVLTVIGFASAIAGIARPALGLLGVGVLCTLDAPSRVLLFTGGFWRWNTLNYLLLIVLVLFASVALRFRDVHTRTLQLLIAVLGIGLVVSPDPASGLLHILGITSCLALQVYFYRERANPAAFYWLGLVCGTVGAAGSFVFLLQQHALPRVNPNALAYLPLCGLLTICMAFAYGGLWAGAQWKLAVLAALDLVAVFLTGSRGAMLIGCAGVLLVVLMMRGMTNRMLAIVVVPLVGITVLTQFTGLTEAAAHRVNVLLNSKYTITDRTSGRYDLVVGAWYIFRDHPWGVGTGGFPVYWEEVSAEGDFTHWRGRGAEFQAHSAWAKTLAENGIPGIVLLGAYVASFVWVGARRRSRAALLAGLLTTTVLALAFLSTEFQGKALWLLAAGMTTLLHYRPPWSDDPRRE